MVLVHVMPSIRARLFRHNFGKLFVVRQPDYCNNVEIASDTVNFRDIQQVCDRLSSLDDPGSVWISTKAVSIRVTFVFVYNARDMSACLNIQTYLHLPGWRVGSLESVSYTMPTSNGNRLL